MDPRWLGVAMALVLLGGGSTSSSSSSSSIVPQPIRIAATVASSDPRVTAAMAWAQALASSSFAVLRTQEALLLARTHCAASAPGPCTLSAVQEAEFCGDVRIPTGHLQQATICDPLAPICRNTTSAPLRTDVYLYLTVQATPVCSRALATALVCRQDKVGRPVAATINLCPDALRDSTLTQASLDRLLLHELLHTLGFHRSLMSSFWDCPPGRLAAESSNPCQPRGAAALDVTAATGRTVLRLPNATAAYRAHLGCPSAEGIPLEDSSDDSTDGGASDGLSAAHHWEALALADEILAPGWQLHRGHRRAVSSITLAAFADMGWYQVNHSAAEELIWGRGGGCALAEGRCELPPTVATAPYLCSTLDVQRCHPNGIELAVCTRSALRNNCASLIVPPGADCAVSLQQSRNGSLDPSGQGACFPVDSSSLVQAACAAKKCLGGLLHLQTDAGAWQACPLPGGPLQLAIQAAQGPILCPTSNPCESFQSDLARRRLVLVHGLLARNAAGLTVTPGLHGAWLDSLPLALERSLTGLCRSQAYITRVAFLGGGHHVETELTVVDQVGCLAMGTVYLRLASRMVQPSVSVDGRTWAYVGMDQSQDSISATVVITNFFGLVWLLNIFGMAVGLLLSLFVLIAMTQNDLAVLRPSMITDVSLMSAAASSEGGLASSSPSADVRNSTTLARELLPSWAHFLAPMEAETPLRVSPSEAQEVVPPRSGPPVTRAARRTAWDTGDLPRFGESAS